MNRFAIAKPDSYKQAHELLVNDSYSLPVLKAGGMDLLDHLKEGLLEPDLLIDVKKLGEKKISRGYANTDNLRIPATTTLAELAESNLVKKQSSVIAQACASAASPQVRNVATAVGNLLQRPRCWYYRNSEFDCLKKDGYMCFAVHGENRYHAIFGGGPCHIVHPSNLALALCVCDGVVHLTGSDRDSIPILELFHMPDVGITSEHTLEANEIITHITAKKESNSGFYAIKEKQSFDWPLVMAAVSLKLNRNVVASAKVYAGAVAPIPWRLQKVEAALKNVAIRDDEAITKACSLAIAGAEPMTDNEYKLKLLPVAVNRAILKAVGRRMQVQDE